MTVNSKEADCLARIRDEVLGLKQQTEVNSFNIEDIKKLLDISEKSYQWDKKRDALFKVGLVVGVIVLLSAVYWSYEKLADRMIKLGELAAAVHTEQTETKKGDTCSTTLLGN